MPHVIDPALRPDSGIYLDPENQLNRGLVRFYDFQQGGGKQVAAVDQFGQAADGFLTLTSGNWTTADERPAGTAWTLNGTSDYATENSQLGFADILSSGSPALSIVMWFKPTSIVGAQTLISRWDQAVPNQIWQLILSAGGGDTNGTIRWFQNSSIGGAGNIDELVTTNAITAGAYHQIVVSVNQTAASVNLQLDGVLSQVANVVYSQPAASVPNLLVGARYNSGTPALFFGGQIAYLAIWKYPLSVQAMQDFWFAPFSNFYGTPARHFFQSSNPMACQPLVPRVPEMRPKVSDRAARFTEIVSSILNSLLEQCQIELTGANKYSLNLAGSNIMGSISVGLAMPAEFSVADSPVTNAGTITVTKVTQAANTVWAGPSSGAAAQPAFRALTSADLPGGSIANSVSNSDGTLTISPTTGAVVASLALGHANTWTATQSFPAASIPNATLANSSITINAPSFQTGWGTVSLGGTLSPSWSNETANQVLAGPTTGAAAAPTFRALVAADYPIPSGATLPASPVKQFFLHTPTGRTILYFYDGTNWKPLYVDGTATIYVDTASGTDDLNHGTGTGANAFQTIQFAVNAVSCLVGGNVTINISAATYTETVTVQGSVFAGNFTLMLKGARAADTLGDTTGATWADQVGNGSAGFTTITKAGAGWTAHAFQDLWLEVTSGTGSGGLYLVHDNTATVITLAGSVADMGGTVGDLTSHFHVFGNATIIDATGHTYGVNILGVPGVTLNQLTIQNASVINAACGNSGVMTLTNCLVKGSSLINVEWYNGSQSGTVSGCSFRNAGVNEVTAATGAQIFQMSGCRLVGNVANAIGLSLQTGAGINALSDSYISETAAGGIGINTNQNSTIGMPNNFVECASCGSHGMLLDTGSQLNLGAGGATNRMITNGGWGCLSQNGGVGSGVVAASASWAGNTLGNYSPNVPLAGGNS